MNYPQFLHFLADFLRISTVNCWGIIMQWECCSPSRNSQNPFTKVAFMVFWIMIIVTIDAILSWKVLKVLVDFHNTIYIYSECSSLIAIKSKSWSFLCCHIVQPYLHDWEKKNLWRGFWQNRINWHWKTTDHWMCAPTT